MFEAPDAASKTEAAEINIGTEPTDEIVLAFIRDGIKDAYCRSESLRLGWMVHLNATGASIWDEAIRRSLGRCYTLLCEHENAVSPLVLFREQARQRLPGSDEEPPGSAAVLTVDSKSSMGSGE
ncbi:hypothetical protein [Streptomyces goshikiensis]